jgi:hypothetical protein
MKGVRNPYPRFRVQLVPMCEKMLSSVSADLLIMGIRGISTLGISHSNSLIVGRATIEAAADTGAGVARSDCRHTRWTRPPALHGAEVWAPVENCFRLPVIGELVSFTGSYASTGNRIGIRKLLARR